MPQDSPPYRISASAAALAGTSSVVAADTSSAAGPEGSSLVVVDSPVVGSHPVAGSLVAGNLLVAGSRPDVVEDTLRIHVLAGRLGCSSLGLRRELEVAVGGGCRKACSWVEDLMVRSEMRYISICEW